ncbi:MAG: hypothetical protein EA397_02865 [Deltaproteobacteria bacterium]|nr:MAG: hypothetical protein EA397_02865 [Deltaproteobacteria bacterium]
MNIEEIDPLAAWAWRAEPTAILIEDAGLINETWAVVIDDEAVGVLQLLNTHIFEPTVHLDIDVITRRLEQRGRQTPRLIPTQRGELWHTDPHGGVWRCLTWVGDTTHSKVSSPDIAESAGALVGSFHAALFGFEHRFAFERPGAHDTALHMTKLQEVLVTHRNHTLRYAVEPLADEIWELWQLLQVPKNLPPRICHGDLKISNVRFIGDRAVALIDLDTLQWGTLDAELGDALRSWCNPLAEDHPEPYFDLDLFEASMRGYLQTAGKLPYTRAEWRSVVPGVERITIELASRFARDALEERYFSWNTRYERAGLHNLARARSMIDLALSVHERADEAEERLDRLRAAGS